MQYYRLKKQADFQRLFNKGKRAFTPTLSVIYRPSEKMTMGISIGKKHGKACKETVSNGYCARLSARYKGK
jgi:ribonuclease P protein component